MHSEVDYTIFGNLKWFDAFHNILRNLPELISFDEGKTSPIFHMFALLDFFSDVNKFSELFENVEKHRTGQNPILITFINTLKLLQFAHKELKFDFNKKISQLKEEYEFSSHPWIDDALVYLETKYLILIGSLEEALVYQSSHSFHWQYWQCRYLLLITRQLIRAADWQNADKYLKQLDFLLSDYDLTLMKAAVTNLKGIYAMDRGNFDSSVDYFTMALKEAQKHGNIDIEQRSINNLGVVYLTLGDYELAEQFIRQSISLETNVETLITSYNNLGFMLYLKGELDGSYQAYLESQKLLSQTPQSVRLSGYLKLGLGLHKASHGLTHESFVIFNSAMEEFVNFNDINGQIYLHGIVGRAFYDNFEFEPADLQFNKFIDLLNKSQSYSTFYVYFCVYVLFLLDQNRVEHIEKHLEHLQVIATENAYNRLIKAWYRFVLGMYEYDRFNLSISENQFRKVIDLSKNSGPYELTLRSYLMLVEIYLRKFLLLGVDSVIQDIEKLLEIADHIGTNHPIFPISIYIKFYQAMFAIHSKKLDKLDNYLNEAQKFIKKSGLKTLKKRFQAMIDYINSQKYFSHGNIYRSLLNALQIGSGRKLRGKKFENDEIGLIAWKLGDTGPIPIAFSISNALLNDNQLKINTMLLGVLLAGILGQGDYYHEGVFGPLPVPSNSKLLCNVASKIVNDSRQEDERLKGKNYTLIAIIYPAHKDMDRFSLQEVLSEWWTNLGDLAQFNESKLHKLKSDVTTHVATTY